VSAGPSLRDIHLPAEPHWWPPAPGWWLLAAVLLVLLAVALRYGLRARRRRRHARQLDALVQAELARHDDHADGAALAAALSQLLRRAARASEPRAAALDGDAWLHWLDGNDPAQPFSHGPGRILAGAPYQRTLPRAAVDAALPLVRARLRSLAGVAHG